MARKTNIYFIFGAVVVLILGLAAIFGGYGWFLNKQQRVLTGTARPSFPYGDYSLEELNKMYPQYPLENVKTTQTPEETYAKLIATLRAGNLEGVKGLLTGRYEEEFLYTITKNNKENDLPKIAELFDFKIKMQEQSDGLAIYKIENPSKEMTIFFFKNKSGVWQLDSL